MSNELKILLSGFCVFLLVCITLLTFVSYPISRKSLSHIKAKDVLCESDYEIITAYIFIVLVNTYTNSYKSDCKCVTFGCYSNIVQANYALSGNLQNRYEGSNIRIEYTHLIFETSVVKTSKGYIIPNRPSSLKEIEGNPKWLIKLKC